MLNIRGSSNLRVAAVVWLSFATLTAISCRESTEHPPVESDTDGSETHETDVGDVHTSPDGIDGGETSDTTGLDGPGLFHQPPCEAGSVGTCDRTVASGESLELAIRAVESGGGSAEGLIVNFEVSAGSDVVDLSSRSVGTDASGRAAVEAAAGAETGSATIRAATSDDKFGELTWSVAVASD